MHAGCGSETAAPAAPVDAGGRRVDTPDAAWQSAPLLEEDAALRCTPVDASTFTPPQWVPPAVPRRACDGVDVWKSIRCRLALEPPDHCTQDDAPPDNVKACEACIFTPSTASAYGPIITSDSLVTLNLGGCLARASGDRRALECGMKVTNAEACAAAACARCVAIGTDAYEACKVQARRSPTCFPYAVDVDCEALFLDGGSQCASGSEFVLVARRLATFFCASDASTDAGPEAAADARAD